MMRMFSFREGETGLYTFRLVRTFPCAVLVESSQTLRIFPPPSDFLDAYLTPSRCDINVSCVLYSGDRRGVSSQGYMVIAIR